MQSFLWLLNGQWILDTKRFYYHLKNLKLKSKIVFFLYHAYVWKRDTTVSSVSAYIQAVKVRSVKEFLIPSRMSD